MDRFTNYYEHCGETWHETADSMCNDRCPRCNAEIEPYDSDEIDDGPPPGSRPTELTPEGEQHVIPGCERRTTAAQPQADLFR